MAKGGKKKASASAASLGREFFGIMLDYEVDSVNEYWPVRNATADIEELKKKVWIDGNPGMIPIEDWEAKLKQSKSLWPESGSQPYSGGIYAFTYIGRSG
ncbi:hypothetical protein H4W19_01590 [Pseudoxanthomonas mexicana]|uniref:Uncharacterized protein n=1 Tax=Pseudoxanthomonas mexicana TaxID=128785 RepID=A0ABX6RCF9_PSEMX|nr:hypothetical protein [Pseudoxanthomonas mexicana]QND80526.1 hypothetical protein H4W19_01590 [Pseudoxanthomonas mexicana]